MIDNYNSSKNPGNFDDAPDYKKYIGVASINVVAINPTNEELTKLGWTVSDGASEPQYVFTKEVDGKMQQSARVRFLVQIQDLPDKPIVPLDFWVGEDYNISKDKSKGKIIDVYGRTAWGTPAEIKAKKVPQTKAGPASISSEYKLCHRGEDQIITFLRKLLNVTPLQMYSKQAGAFVSSVSLGKTPGKLTIDNWQRLCDGDTSEIKEYVALQPENCVKVVFGIKTTEDNKSYQTFLIDCYIGNGAIPDKNSGIYTTASKEIDKFLDNWEKRNPGVSPNVSYSAAPIKEWNVSASEVTDQSGNMFDGSEIERGYDPEDNENFDPAGDLPF